MYCNNCGKFLTGEEHFCSNCGTKIEPKQETSKEAMKEFTKPDINWGSGENFRISRKRFADVSREEETNIKLTPPTGIEWNLDEFNYETNRQKEEGEDFKWDTEGMFHKDESHFHAAKDKLADVESSGNNTPGEDTQELYDENAKHVDVPSIDYEGLFKKLEFPKKDLETVDSIAKDIRHDENSTPALRAEQQKIDKFYTFSKSKEEFQRQLDEEYERIKKEELQSGLGMEKDYMGFQDISLEPQREITTQAEEMVRARQQIFKNGNEGLNEGLLDDVERSKLLGEESIAEIKARLDKAGTKVDDEEPVAHEDMLSAISDEVDEELKNTEDIELKTSEHGEGIQETTSHEDEESHDDAEVPEVDDHVDTDTGADVHVDTDADDYAEDEADSVADVEDKAEATSTQVAETNFDQVAETDEDEAADTADENIKEDEAAEYKDDDIQATTKDQLEETAEFLDEDVHVGGGIGRFFKFLLVLIILAIIALVGFRFAMPGHPLSLYIDKQVNRVVKTFMPEDDMKADADVEEEVVADDSEEDPVAARIRGFVNTRYNDNYKNIISQMDYREPESSDDNMRKKLGLGGYKSIEKKEWKTNSQGAPLYYDEEVVGAIIAFESQKIAYYKEKDREIFKTVKAGSEVGRAIEKDKINYKNIKEYKLLNLGEVLTKNNEKFCITVKVTDDLGDKTNTYVLEPLGDSMVVVKMYVKK